MIFLLIILDQISKYIACTTKLNFDILGDFLRIEYVQNTGTIFGLFENSNYVFLSIAIILCILIAIYMRKNIEKKSFKEKTFLLILAGGIGNIIDRIVRGYVVDFISLKWVGIFNFSDAYIVIGVFLIIILEIKEMVLKKDFKQDGGTKNSGE